MNNSKDNRRLVDLLMELDECYATDHESIDAQTDLNAVAKAATKCRACARAKASRRRYGRCGNCNGCCLDAALNKLENRLRKLFPAKD